jgi:hypothetical protein
LTTFRKKARWSENLTSGRPQSKLNEVRVVDPASRIVLRAMKPRIDRSRVTAFGRGANARAAGVQPLARTRRRAMVWLLASAMAALGTAREQGGRGGAPQAQLGAGSEAERSGAEERTESRGA